MIGGCGLQSASPHRSHAITKLAMAVYILSKCGSACGGKRKIRKRSRQVNCVPRKSAVFRFADYGTRFAASRTICKNTRASGRNARRRG